MPNGKFQCATRCIHIYAKQHCNHARVNPRWNAFSAWRKMLVSHYIEEGREKTENLIEVERCGNDTLLRANAIANMWNRNTLPTNTSMPFHTQNVHANLSVDVNLAKWNKEIEHNWIGYYFAVVIFWIQQFAAPHTKWCTNTCVLGWRCFLFFCCCCCWRNYVAVLYLCQSFYLAWMCTRWRRRRCVVRFISMEQYYDGIPSFRCTHFDFDQCIKPFINIRKLAHTWH